MIPQMIPCPECKREGFTYEKRGEDVHIIKCGQCEGAGLIQYAWPKERKEPETINLDTLLAEETCMCGSAVKDHDTYSGHTIVLIGAEELGGES